MPENWVDIAVLFLLTLFALRGIQRGLIRGVLDLVAFVAALVAALWFYPQVGALLAPYVALPPALLKPLAFLGLWLAADVVAAVVVRLLAVPVGYLVRGSVVDHLLGALPGAVKGVVLAALGLTLLVVLPLPDPVKAQVHASALGQRLAEQVPQLEQTVHAVFGEAILEGLSFATVRPQSDERVALRFTVPDASIDPGAEGRLLQLVNEERQRAGLHPLQPDPQLTAAARAHARDMLAQGYFAHVDDAGKTPADRARAAGVRFTVAGENLALAPTVELAHRGLMESPGHRANILSPLYTRIGIGVADAGLHGKMFAQEFAD